MIHNKAAKLTVVGTLIVALFLFAGCGKKDDSAANSDKSVPVAVNQAKTDRISAKTVITGKVTPLQEVIIVPKVGGKVAQVPVDVGTRVKKGALLVKIDTTDLEISLSGAINGMTNAKLTHDQAVLNYNNAKANYDRMKSLYNEGAISQQQLEQAQLSYNLSRDAMNQPVVGTAKTQVDSITNQIANGTITSPIDGEVAVRSIDPGEMAGPTQPVMTVVNIEKVYVEGTVSESDIALVKEGQKVTVKVDSAGGNFEGTVKTLSPVTNPQTKGYPVKIEIMNSDRKLKPGMFGEIELVTKDKEDAIVVPKEALVTRGADKMLYVVKNNVVEERKVETGIESDEKVEITKGLAQNEQYVIEGQQSLFDKAKVTVKTGSTGS